LRPRAALVYLGDRMALRLADRVIADTRANAEFYADEFGAARAKTAVIPVGAPEWLFAPSALPPRDVRPLTVLFYGSFIPLHGANVIVDAAHALRSERRIRFVLVGAGQTLTSVRARREARPGADLEFRPAVPLRDLPALVAAADICLGIFGTSDKAHRVVPNKVWQCLAAGRPVVTGNGRGAREVLADGRHALLVPHGDGDALAQAILRLAGDEALSARLAAAGAQLVRDRYTSAPLGRRLRDVITDAIADVRDRTPG
jgi:glycosyltransferase involved in cell wall biosynthesis